MREGHLQELKFLIKVRISCQQSPLTFLSKSQGGNFKHSFLLSFCPLSLDSIRIMSPTRACLKRGKSHCFFGNNLLHLGFLEKRVDGKNDRQGGRSQVIGQDRLRGEDICLSLVKISVLGSQRRKDHWRSLTNQSNLISEVQVNNRLYLKKVNAALEGHS